MNKQTAIEWLANQILDNWNDIDAGAKNIMEFIEQAKEMEKEQIENSFIEGANTIYAIPKTFDEYYNETYGGAE